ncbi:MAG: hypothetical protein ACJ8KU_00670 [Chthoniobacterales bacterium]
MNTWIEPPPQKRRSGCLKGCVLILLFLLAVIVAIGVISYRSVTSAKIPQVAPDASVQEEARSRWDAFAQAARSGGESATPGETAAPIEQAAPAATPASRVEFNANDINQLIAANRKARGKAFVRIENNIGYAQVSVPLKKLKFGDRNLVISGEVHASPDHDPRKLTVHNLTLGGVEFPEAVLNGLVGGRSLASYIDQYASEYQISGFAIEDNKVILETNGGR